LTRSTAALRLAFTAETEEMMSTVFEAFAQAMPIAEGVTTTTVTSSLLSRVRVAATFSRMC
jgi:hypothetical protein